MLDLAPRYDPRDHYWIVGGDETKVWSSAKADLVPADDVTYKAWLPTGRAPSRIANRVELADVLLRAYPAGAPNLSFTAAELIEAYTRIDQAATEALFPGGAEGVADDDLKLAAHASVLGLKVRAEASPEAELAALKAALIAKGALTQEEVDFQKDKGAGA
jgi:hypothetical protein